MNGIKQIHIKILLPAIVISSLVLTSVSVGGGTTIFFGAEAQMQQNQTADPQQVKSYLDQAIQAIDGGNNTQALHNLNKPKNSSRALRGQNLLKTGMRMRKKKEKKVLVKWTISPSTHTDKSDAKD